MEGKEEEHSHIHMEERGELGENVANRKSIGGNWEFKGSGFSLPPSPASCDNLSLADLLPGKEKKLLYSCWCRRVENIFLLEMKDTSLLVWGN